MSENYFTGQIDQNSTQKTSTTAAPAVYNKNPQSVEESIQNLKTEEQKKQTKDQQIHQKPQQTQEVNLDQVIIQEQQPDDQKFIESNPELAQEQKKIANQKYGAKQYTQALEHYRKSLQFTASTSQQDKKFRSVIYSNIGLTYTKMLDDETAIKYFKESLKMNPSYTKARTNLAQCYQNTDKPQQALDEYKKVLETNPNDNYVKQKIIPLEIKVKQLQEKRKQEVIGGLKNIGNSILGWFGMSLDNFKLQQNPNGGYSVSMNK